MKKDIRKLRGAMLDLFGVLSRPQPDAALIEEAKIDLDRALFPLMVRIDRFGPIGIVELAEQCGRDHTTVSRQISKLEELGLVRRVPSPTDKRLRAVKLTAQGHGKTHALDDARQKLYERLLKDWKPEEVHMCSVLMRRIADRAIEWSKSLK